MTMFKVKRTKGPPPPAIGGATVLWATEIAGRGNVGGWTRDERLAALVGEDVAAKVRAFYAGRPNAGLVECVPEKAEPAKAEPKAEESKPVAPQPAQQPKQAEQVKAVKPRHKQGE